MKLKPCVVDVVCMIVGMVLGAATMHGMMNLYQDIERVKIEVNKEKAVHFSGEGYDE